MATNPEPDPIADEGNRLLDEDPELLASLQEFERRLEAGEEVKLHPHSEARRIVGLDPQPELWD